ERLIPALAGIPGPVVLPRGAPEAALDAASDREAVHRADLAGAEREVVDNVDAECPQAAVVVLESAAERHQKGGFVDERAGRVIFKLKVAQAKADERVGTPLCVAPEI